jgi:osmotically-inducible protein OsmY
MNQTLRRIHTGAVLTLCGSALLLAACGNKASDRTAGQNVDSAIARTEQAGAEAKAKAEQMARDAKAKTESAASSISAAVDDAAITADVTTGLAKDPDLSAIKIDVDTKGGVVSLNGPAPNAAAKAHAEEIAKSVKGVVEVNNNLDVKSM